MVTIGADVQPRPRRARVTLAALLAERDASIATKPRPFALAGLRAKRTLAAIGGVSARAASLALTLLIAIATFAGRHGLVLGGLAAFIVAASLHSTITGLIVGGLSLFFLELRRR